MKALSVKQPYAGWIASGRKTLEIRSWATDYRGELLIVSSQKTADGYRAGDYLLGRALCVVQVVDCRPMTQADTDRACCELMENTWAWELEVARKITPFPVKGKLRLYEVDCDVSVRP